MVKSKATNNKYLFWMVPLLIIFWFLIYFVGYFFASRFLFPIVSIFLAVLIYLFTKRFSKKVALLSVFITIAVSLFTIVSSFEEDYCWNKGEEADNTGLKMTVATKEDEETLKGFDVKKGAQIGVSFRTHMLCHNTFNFTKAIKEKY